MENSHNETMLQRLYNMIHRNVVYVFPEQVENARPYNNIFDYIGPTSFCIYMVLFISYIYNLLFISYIYLIYYLYLTFI